MNTDVHEPTEKGVESDVSDPGTENSTYTPQQVTEVRIIYLVGIVAWILLSWYFGFFPTTDTMEWLIFLLPIVLFLVAWASIPYVSGHVESFMYRSNILTLGLLIALPLLSWVEVRHPERKQFVPIMGTAIILSMLTLVDIWVPHDQLPWIKHIKSIMQTVAIVLLVYGLYRYFVDPNFEAREANLSNERQTEAT
jgi:hypothetical protein